MQVKINSRELGVKKILIRYVHLTALTFKPSVARSQFLSRSLTVSKKLFSFNENIQETKWGQKITFKYCRCVLFYATLRGGIFSLTWDSQIFIPLQGHYGDKFKGFRQRRHLENEWSPVSSTCLWELRGLLLEEVTTTRLSPQTVAPPEFLRMERFSY